MKKPILTLFLTEGMSLKEWDRIGLLHRELALYQKLNAFFNIQIFSYGDVGDLHYETVFPWLRVLIIPYYVRFPSLKNRLHSWKALWRLRSSSLLKTNQIPGSDKAVYFSSRFSIPLIARCGYLWSVFTENKNESATEIERVSKIEESAFQNAKIGFTSSERDRVEVIRRYKISPEKVVCIPNYVDQSVFFPPIKDREKGHLLFIGRLSEQKNLFSLLEAFEKSGSATKLTIIGSGEQEMELKTAAAKLTKQVEFVSHLPNSALAGWLQRCSAYILPSFYEGLPKTLLEAMSCGCACIATSVQGIDDVITHEKDGFLTKTDSESISKGIDFVLSNPELAKNMGIAAAETIRKTYSLDTIARMELAVYKELLNI